MLEVDLKQGAPVSFSRFLKFILISVVVLENNARFKGGIKAILYSFVAKIVDD